MKFDNWCEDDLISRQEAIKSLTMFGAEHNAIAVIRGCPSRGKAPDKPEIEIGDEVVYRSDKADKTPMFVTRISQDLYDGHGGYTEYSFDAICRDGRVCEDRTLAAVQRTGRSYPRLKSLLEDMGRMEE